MLPPFSRCAGFNYISKTVSCTGPSEFRCGAMVRQSAPPHPTRKTANHVYPYRSKTRGIARVHKGGDQLAGMDVVRRRIQSDRIRRPDGDNCGHVSPAGCRHPGIGPGFQRACLATGVAGSSVTPRKVVDAGRGPAAARFCIPTAAWHPPGLDICGRALA